MTTNTIYTGDALDVLRTLPDESVHCVVTSPPYWNLRDYNTAEWEGGDEGCEHSPIPHAQARELLGSNGKPGKNCTSWSHRDATPSRVCKCGARRIDRQLGLEDTPEAYLERMVAVFGEVRRVLRSDGCCFCNMGDGYMDKQLVGMPWRLALALQADGWWLRQDIIWSKPNPMPESVTDRCTKAHEYVFLLTKAARYFYDSDAVREGVTGDAHAQGSGYGKKIAEPGSGVKNNSSFAPAIHNATKDDLPTSRNRRSVWNIATQPFPEAHFATFPEALVEPCIKAGCPHKVCAVCGAPWVRVVDRRFVPQEDVDPAKRVRGSHGQKSMPARNGWQGVPRGSTCAETKGWKPTCACDADTTPGVVLDPFMGSGTVALVATKLTRRYLGIELSPEYAEMARRRVRDAMPLFAGGG